MKNKDVLLIDDECVLCNKTVAYLIEKGGDEKFRFLSLYSDEGKQLLTRYGLPEDYIESVVLIKKDNAYTKSDAVIKVTEELKGWIRMVSWSKIVPGLIRNAIYDLVAKHRHKIN